MGFEILNVSRPSRVGEGRVGDRPLDFWATAILYLKALADVISLIAGKRSVSLILVKANKRDSGNSLA
jgi:hypothetical protein